jgi:hypothetical protein
MSHLRMEFFLYRSVVSLQEAIEITTQELPALSPRKLMHEMYDSSAIRESVRKQHPMLPGTPVDLTSDSKYI